jgi:hypothetical protein
MNPWILGDRMLSKTFIGFFLVLYTSVRDKKITMRIGTRMTRILQIFWDVSFLGIHCDTNRCTDFTDFTD